MSEAVVDLFNSLSAEERAELLSTLSPEVKASLKYCWPFWARANQLAPEGDWTTWLILAGRGFGKTRTGAEWVRQMAFDYPGCRIALVAETAADARKVMIEGESGLLAVSPPDFMPEYSPANRQITWPNGSIAFTYNATEPDQLRGPQHHFAWSDELAKWEKMQDSWDQLQFGLRLGLKPRQIVTTTPRPLPVIKALVNDPKVHVTKGKTSDNYSNLPQHFMEYIYEKFDGTRLGRQELEGEILDDVPGALWSRSSIDQHRVKEAPADLERVIVAVDPAVSSEEGSDEHGIVVVAIGRNAEGYQEGYVLEDGTVKGKPEDWAKAAVRLYRLYQADKIVAEKNQGGEMVASVIKSVDRNVPVKLVHASRGKHVRAEPISALYEQGRVHHVGRFDKLEDQMCIFSVENLRSGAMGSPDRVDALVWGLTEVFDKITGRRKTSSDGTSGLNKSTTRRSLALAAGGPTGWMAG